MGLADGEGAGDAAGTEGAEWTGSGEGEAAVVVTGVFDAWGEAAAEDSTMAGTTGEPKTGKTSVTEETITRILCCVTKTFIIYASLQVMTFNVVPIVHY